MTTASASPNPESKETLHTAIRIAVESAGNRPITLKKFATSSGLGRRAVHRHYPTWNDALRAAGFDFEPYNQRLDGPRLLADWAAVVRKLRRIPSMAEYDIHGKYTPGTFHDRFGAWCKVPAAFRAFAGRRPQWKNVLPLLPAPGTARVWGGTRSVAEHRPRVPRRLARPSRRTSPPRSTGRPFCGPLLEFGGMRNAPLNEIGVIFLFGILAERLGFHIEALQIAFPDCEAKRRIGPSAWQSVRIEFEYESRNFRDHGHNPGGCDLIVCWNHNWAECPANLEVVALSEEIKRFAVSKT